MEQVLGGVAHRHDTRRKQQAHDYDIELPDGTVIALEITQHVAESVIETDNLIAKHHWGFECLRRDWFVDVVAGVRVQELHAYLPKLLKQLEDARVERRAFSHSDIRAGQQELAALGVLSCRSYESHEPVARVQVDQLTADPSHNGEATLESMVQNLAQKKASTLGNACALTERHLLIWLDHTNLDGRSAMERGELPSRIPALPAEVDVVWLALSVRQPVLWRVDSTGWSNHGRIDQEHSG